MTYTLNPINKIGKIIIEENTEVKLNYMIILRRLVLHRDIQTRLTLKSND